MRKSLIASLALLLASGTAAFADGASDGVVKIGILNDQSGVYADFGGKSSVEAAKMAAEDFGGKVLGVPIEIVNADHQNKPDIASNIARQWYDQDKVDAIMELTTSSVALAVQAIAKEKKRSTSSRVPRPPISPASNARPMASTGPMTRMRWPSAPAARWSSRAATPGSS